MKTFAFTIALLALVSTSSAYAQKERMGNFEIQGLMSAFNQAETLSSNLKALITQQIPAEFASVAAKSAAWDQQTAVLQGMKGVIDSTLGVISAALKDKQLTRSEWTHAQACTRAACNSYTAGASIYHGADAILKRRFESVSLLYKALCTNEN
jgi:hypothetical protein